MRTVTCETSGCINAGHPIDVAADGSPVMCGPCGHWIIPPPEEPTEPADETEPS